MERVEGCGDYFEKGCVDIFNSKFVKHLTDNQNVERISEVGSMKNDLQSLAIDIFHVCAQNCICLKVQWIPRELNILADQYSKIFDFDDWSVADRIFHYFDQIWGPFLLTVTIKSCIDLTRDS